MPRQISAVAEAVADHDPFGSLNWLVFPEDAQPFIQEADQFLLFLGFDAGLKNVNTVDRMIDWVKYFDKLMPPILPKAYSATVFVLDWPKGIESHQPALPDDRDIDKLMEAGLYYRPKDPVIYGDLKVPLASLLLIDLKANHLLPQAIEVGEPVAARPLPDESDSSIAENAEFMASKQLIWSKATIDKLLGR